MNHFSPVSWLQISFCVAKKMENFFLMGLEFLTFKLQLTLPRKNKARGFRLFLFAHVELFLVQLELFWAFLSTLECLWSPFPSSSWLFWVSDNFLKEKFKNTEKHSSLTLIFNFFGLFSTPWKFLELFKTEVELFWAFFSFFFSINHSMEKDNLHWETNC